jgi:hypothetical protein
VSRYSWDHEARVKHMDAEGIAAEVMFPNTVPPFYPSGAVTALAPKTAEEYRYRWEGVKAHNRWAVDFCDQLPGRRIGLAQVFVDDVDDAIAEMRWAKDAGMSGVLIPGDAGALYDPRYDPLWAASCDLGLPVHRHAIIVTETPPARHRRGCRGCARVPVLVAVIGHMVLGGVPAATPTSSSSSPRPGASWGARAAQSSTEIAFGKTPGQARSSSEGGRGLDLSATEHFRRNCWIGMSTVRPDEIAMRHEVG